MQHELVLGSHVHCTDGKGGSLTQLVVNPATNQLEYVVVHRGLFGGHNHCVPSGDIARAQDHDLTLTISVAQLKDMPDLEIKVPGTDYKQRSIPERCAVLGRGTAVKDAGGSTLGALHGLIANEAFHVEQLLLDGSDLPTIPVADLLECSEDSLTVRLAERVIE